MTREEAIERYDRIRYNLLNREDKAAVDVAFDALKEQEERSKGCGYCRGVESIYQHTNTTKISINSFGKARALMVECNLCPPYSDCCARGVPDRSAFIIRYCPECGRRLEEA